MQRAFVVTVGARTRWRTADLCRSGVRRSARASSSGRCCGQCFAAKGGRESRGEPTSSLDARHADGASRATFPDAGSPRGARAEHRAAREVRRGGGRSSEPRRRRATASVVWSDFGRSPRALVLDRATGPLHEHVYVLPARREDALAFAALLTHRSQRHGVRARRAGPRRIPPVPRVDCWLLPCRRTGDEPRVLAPWPAGVAPRPRVRCAARDVGRAFAYAHRQRRCRMDARMIELPLDAAGAMIASPFSAKRSTSRASGQWCCVRIRKMQSRGRACCDASRRMVEDRRRSRKRRMSRSRLDGGAIGTL